MLRLDTTDFTQNVPDDVARLNDDLLAKLTGTDQWSVEPKVVRQMRRLGQGAFPAPVFSERAQVIEIAGPRGPLTLRIIRPEVAKGVYLHIHGGGWTYGSADFQDPWLDHFADQAQMASVSVEYGLAPEDPYPAGPDDCEAAALWLAREAKGLFGTDRLMIGGESAGAHLAVVTLLRLRDRHGITPFCGANLHAGCYDLALSPSARLWGEPKLVLNTRDIEMFARHFLLRGGDVRSADISPIHADLRSLPPALFTVGTRDPLLDDSLMMAPKWLAAGNEARLKVYAGGCHVFIAFACTHTTACMAEMVDFMRAQTAG